MAATLVAPLGASELPSLIERAPQVAVAEARLAAMQARQGGAGAWDDPRVEIEHMRSREAGGGREWELRASQPLPIWGQRGAERAMAAAEVDMAAAELALVRSELATEVGRLAAGVVAATAEHDIQEGMATRARLVEKTIRAGLATDSMTRVGDLLAIQTRIEVHELAALRARNESADMVAMVHARLGTTAVPAWAQWPRPDVAEVAVDHHPALRMAAARQRLATAAGAMAQSMGRPMVEVGVGWGTMREGEMREDRVMGMLMFSVPVQRAPIRAGVAAALADSRLAEAEASGMRFMAQASLDRAQRATALAAEATERAARTVTRLDAEVIAAQQALAVEQSGGLTAVLERLDQIAEAQMLAITAERAAAEAAAELWPLIPWKDSP